MKKYNLPVILLNGIILLPNNTLKLEFDSKNTDNNVIDMSLLFHNNNILVVSEYNTNKEIGVLAKIKNNLELPNGNTRIEIVGIKRVKVIEFLNLSKTNEPLESIVSEFNVSKIENEELIISKIKKELKEYIKLIPYVSNSILDVIEKTKNGELVKQ